MAFVANNSLQSLSNPLLYSKGLPTSSYPPYHPIYPLPLLPSFFIIKYYFLQLNHLAMTENCEGCRQKEKQFKVVQVQLQFQIKKLHEDMAHLKLTLEMAHQKEYKKLMEKINFTKNERQLQNKSWMEKYDAMTQLYEEKLKIAQQKCDMTISEVKLQMASRQQASTQESENRLRREIVLIKAENEDYKKKLLVSKEEEKKYLAKVHEEEMGKLAEKHRIEVQGILQEKKALQQSLMNCEIAQRNHEMITFQLKEELGTKKKEAEGLKEKIHMLENKIKIYFQPEIHSREKQTTKLRKEHEKVCAKMKEEWKAEKEKLIKDFNANIEQILQKEYKRCVEYEQKLKDLDQHRQKELAFYQRSLQQLKSASDQKFIPKSQFHEQISTLKVRLTSKEKDIERAKEQIKQCKLQIQNNEQILNKFFRPSNHNHSTAPDIFVHTPNKKKEYKIKKNRASMGGMSGMNYLQVGKSMNGITSITSMESLDTPKNQESFRML